MPYIEEALNLLHFLVTQ